MKTREIIFWVFAFAVGLISLKLTSHMELWLKMCIRVPEVYVMALIYKKFVRKDNMTTKLNKWRFKGWLHYPLLVTGSFEFIYMIYKTRTEHIPHFEFEDMIEIILSTPIHLLLLALLATLPFYYAFTQFIFYIRIFTVWVYNNKRKWFETALVIEDIIVVGIVSLLA